MRHAAIAGVLAALCLATAPAFAHVVEVTTSIGLHEASDPDQLQGAVKSAVETVLDEAIAFVPTAITVTSARVVGERVYIGLLIVDAAGEEALRDLSDGERDEPENNRSS